MHRPSFESQLMLSSFKDMSQTFRSSLWRHERYYATFFLYECSYIPQHMQTDHLLELRNGLFHFISRFIAALFALCKRGDTLRNTFTGVHISR